MNLFKEILAEAIKSAVIEHPKLFTDLGRERAAKVIVRAVVRELTREPEASDAPIETVPPAPVGPTIVPDDDPRAVAYCELRRLAGAVAPLRGTGGSIVLPVHADTAAVRVFAELPSRKEWPFVTARPQLTAWLEFFDGVLPDVSRRKIFEDRDGVSGIDLPWAWPPSKTGKIYEHALDNEDIDS